MGAGIIHLGIVPDFAPGDPPPSGYVAWHEWADVQAKAGLKQVTCGRCGKWHFPQELSATVDTVVGRVGRGANRGGGREVVIQRPVCLACDSKG